MPLFLIPILWLIAVALIVAFFAGAERLRGGPN